MHLHDSSNEPSAALDLRAAALDEYMYAAEMRQQMAVEHDGDFDARSAGWRERYCAYFAAKQDADTAQLFLAFAGGKPIGMAVVSLLDNYRTAAFDMRIAYVNSVYVLPEHRRRGIARRLMEMTVRWAREHRCSQMRLRASDQGRPLYASLGFKPTSEMQLDL